MNKGDEAIPNCLFCSATTLRLYKHNCGELFILEYIENYFQFRFYPEDLVYEISSLNGIDLYIRVENVVNLDKSPQEILHKFLKFKAFL